MDRILIIRLSAIGDVIMASGVLPVLRATWPQARIDWLVEPVEAELLQGHPDIDTVLPLPLKPWRKALKARRYGEVWREFRAARRRLRATRYDLVVDLQGLLKSAVWARLARADRRLGLDPKEHSGILYSDRAHATHPDRKRIGQDYEEALAHLGLDVSGYQLSLPRAPDAVPAVEAFLAQHDLTTGKFVALCPYTTRPQKHWFDDHWARLAELIHERLGLPSVILIGPSNGPDADTLRARTPDLPVHVAHDLRLSLRAKIEIMARARAAVGVDTGLTHLAAALHTPIVALFGSTFPYADTRGAPSRILYDALPCSPCRRKPTCGGAFTCLREITPTRVCQALDELLTADA